MVYSHTLAWVFSGLYLPFENVTIFFFVLSSCIQVGESVAEEPGEFIVFQSYIAVDKPIDGYERRKSRITINVFDLNGTIGRKDLEEQRENEWKKFRSLVDLTVDYSDSMRRIATASLPKAGHLPGLFSHHDERG